MCEGIAAVLIILILVVIAPCAFMWAVNKWM